MKENELEDLSKNIPDYSQSSVQDIEQNQTQDTTQYISSFRLTSNNNQDQNQQSFCNKLLQALNIDALDSSILPTTERDINGPNERDSRTLLRQYEQMKGVVRCWSLTLHLLSYLYVYTRVQSYFELKDYKDKNNQSMLGKVGQRYESIELLHYITIVHSISTVIISGLVYKSMRKGQFFDRRQYMFLIGITTFVTVLYFFSLFYVMYKGSQSARDGSVMSIVEQIAEIIGAISSNNLAFIFATFMNFILIFGLYTLNMCNVILLDLAKSIEQRRTGGRGQNELELNRLVMNKK